MNRVFALLLKLFGRSSEARKPLSPEDFTRVFVGRLLAMAPGHEVTVIEALHLKLRSAEGHETTAFLRNAYATYLQSPEEQEAIMTRHIGSYLDVPQAGQPLDSSRIVPVVKDRGWMAEVRRSSEEAGTPGAAFLKVLDELNEDLVVLYAEDSPTNIRYFSDDDLVESGIERSSLRALAVANLRRILPKVEVHRGPQVCMLTAGADYVSSLLLLEELWEPRKLGLEGEIVLAVPSRDVVLVTSSQSEEGVRQLRRMAQETARDSPYSVTEMLFVHRQGRFQRLDA
jgi:uncharacterized protein YtpQ (UPF0354 family)